MEKEEIIKFLRDHLTVNVTLDKKYEDDNSFITCSISLQIDGEEINSSYDSVYVDNNKNYL